MIKHEHISKKKLKDKTILLLVDSLPGALKAGRLALNYLLDNQTRLILLQTFNVQGFGLYKMRNLTEKADSKKIAPEFVTMNSVVQVMNESTKRPMTIRIVYPTKADFKKGYVSVLSPLGSALLGYNVGDTVQFDAPKGIVTIRIQQIDYQPEANGEYLV